MDEDGDGHDQVKRHTIPTSRMYLLCFGGEVLPGCFGDLDTPRAAAPAGGPMMSIRIFFAAPWYSRALTGPDSAARKKKKSYEVTTTSKPIKGCVLATALLAAPWASDRAVVKMESK